MHTAKELYKLRVDQRQGLTSRRADIGSQQQLDAYSVCNGLPLEHKMGVYCLAMKFGARTSELITYMIAQWSVNIQIRQPVWSRLLPDLPTYCLIGLCSRYPAGAWSLKHTVVLAGSRKHVAEKKISITRKLQLADMNICNGPIVMSEQVANLDVSLATASLICRSAIAPLLSSTSLYLLLLGAQKILQ